MPDSTSSNRVPRSWLVFAGAIGVVVGLVVGGIFVGVMTYQVLTARGSSMARSLSPPAELADRIISRWRDGSLFMFSSDGTYAVIPPQISQGLSEYMYLEVRNTRDDAMIASGVAGHSPAALISFAMPDEMAFPGPGTIDAKLIETGQIRFMIWSTGVPMTATRPAWTPPPSQLPEVDITFE